jgi:hypothetical protein
VNGKLSQVSPDDLFSEEEKAMLVFAVEEAGNAVCNNPGTFEEEDFLALEVLKEWLGLA